MLNLTKIIQTTLWAIVSLLSLQQPALADDICEAYCDYLCRHERMDIVPQGLSFRKVTIGSRQLLAVSVTVKARGDNPFNPQQENKSIDIRISGVGTRTATISNRIEVGASQPVFVGFASLRSMRHCQKKSVSIDLTKDAGQWGCGVYGNDKAMLRAFEKGKTALCFAKPRPLPIPNRPIER